MENLTLEEFKMDKLIWNVYMFDYTKKQLEVFNIFDHYDFWKDFEKLCDKYNYFDEDYDLKEDPFKKEFEKLCKYYFWGKAEYEFTLTGSPSDTRYETKISIYEQLKLNWEQFYEYVDLAWYDHCFLKDMVNHNKW